MSGEIINLQEYRDRRGHDEARDRNFGQAAEAALRIEELERELAVQREIRRIALEAVGMRVLATPYVRQHEMSEDLW